MSFSLLFNKMRTPAFWFLLSVLFFVLYAFNGLYIRKIINKEKLVDNLQTFINTQLDQQKIKADEISTLLEEYPNNNWSQLEHAVEDVSLFVQVYNNDSLLFWNSNQIITFFTVRRKLKRKQATQQSNRKRW